MPLCTMNGQYWLFEYNYIARNSSTPAIHSEGWQDFGSDDIIIRHNLWEDIEGTSFIALKKNYYDTNDRWEIYGNVFYYTDENLSGREGIGGNGTIGEAGSSHAPCNDIKVYNNAFINIPGLNTGIFFPYGTGNEVYNNIWYNCNANTISLSPSGETLHDYNWFYNNWRTNLDPDVLLDTDLVASEEHAEQGTEDPFVDWKNKDFRLKAPTDSGKSLLFPYNLDINGNIRGEDAVWDKGAYEFN